MKICSSCVVPTFRQCAGGCLAVVAIALAIIGALGASGHLPGINVLIAGKIPLSQLYLVYSPLMLGLGMFIALFPRKVGEKKEAESSDSSKFVPGSDQEELEEEVNRVLRRLMLPVQVAAITGGLNFLGVAQQAHQLGRISDVDLRYWTNFQQNTQNIQNTQQQPPPENNDE